MMSLESTYSNTEPSQESYVSLPHHPPIVLLMDILTWYYSKSKVVIAILQGAFAINNLSKSTSLTKNQDIATQLYPPENNISITDITASTKLKTEELSAVHSRN